MLQQITHRALKASSVAVRSALVDHTLVEMGVEAHGGLDVE